jgi:hypothetical protein
MDQDTFGAYGKQRIESLTTDGEGKHKLRMKSYIGSVLGDDHDDV